MKKKILLIIFIITIIGLLVTAFVNIHMINTTKNQIVHLDSIKDTSFDAILVLGCKVENNYPSMMLTNRLEKAMETYQKLNTKLLLSGDHGTKEYDEVEVMKNYLLDSKINIKDIFLDHAGFNTYDSIYRAKYIFGAKKIVIVTQKYHLYRALYLANQLGIEAYGIEADDIPYRSIMIKNEIREILARDKNFIKAIFKPQSKYLGEKISLLEDGNVED